MTSAILNFQDYSVPQDDQVRREWIKYQLKVRGYSLAKIAKENKVSRQTISNVLINQAPRWEFEIAQKLDLFPWVIWPERYDSETKLPVVSADEGSK